MAPIRKSPRLLLTDGYENSIKLRLSVNNTLGDIIAINNKQSNNNKIHFFYLLDTVWDRRSGFRLTTLSLDFFFNKDSVLNSSSFRLPSLLFESLSSSGILALIIN